MKKCYYDREKNSGKRREMEGDIRWQYSTDGQLTESE